MSSKRIVRGNPISLSRHSLWLQNNNDPIFQISDSWKNVQWVYSNSPSCLCWESSDIALKVPDSRNKHTGCLYRNDATDQMQYTLWKGITNWTFIRLSRASLLPNGKTSLLSLPDTTSLLMSKYRLCHWFKLYWAYLSETDDLINWG